jgi:quercetin dioxygenase-like cupin family protein
MVKEMKKINVKEGKRYCLKTHINEMLLPREKAEIIEAFRVIIEPEKCTHLHAHDDTEQLYYVISGKGYGHFTTADGKTSVYDLQPEDVIYIPRNTEHQIFCKGSDPLVYLCVDGFPQGKPTEEATWDDHFRAMR